MNTRTNGIFAGLLIALACLLLVGCSANHPGPRVSDDEINQSQTALGQARSWQVVLTLTEGGQRMHLEEDVVCPFLFHRVGRLKPGGREKIIALKDAYYYRENAQWFSPHSSNTDDCREGPKAGAAGLAAPIPPGIP